MAIAQYINNGNTNVVNPVITITATGDDVVSVHLECNVCSLTYTGNVAIGHKLIIDCGARSVTNSGIGDYNGLAFDGKPPHARMVYPGAGCQHNQLHDCHKNIGSTPPPTMVFEFYDGWE